MEKSNERIKQLINRLLICLFVVINISTLSARTPTWEEISRLRFTPSQEYFFTATECPFTVEIVDVKPETIVINVNTLPDNVSYVSSKKEAYLPVYSKEGEMISSGGTRITLYLKFSKPGKYNLRPVEVRINNLYYTVKVANCEVMENPRFILPELSYVFEDNLDISPSKKQLTIHSGEHIRFTVYIQYAVFLNDMSWSIPQDSIFQEIERYELKNAKPQMGNESYSFEKYPIATFDWQPLVKGTYKFPEFYVSATAYNGSSYDLSLSNYTVRVIKELPTYGKTEKEESIFGYAFTQNENSDEVEELSNITDEDLYELQQLYSKEKVNLPLVSNATKKRRALERNLGLNPGNVVNRIPLMIIFILITIILFNCSLCLFIKKKRYAAVGIFCLFLVALTGTSIYSSDTVKTTAIYKGGELSTIPEEDVYSGVSLKRGIVVTVVRGSKDWKYIRWNDTYGWIKEENLLYIK